MTSDKNTKRSSTCHEHTSLSRLAVELVAHAIDGFGSCLRVQMPKNIHININEGDPLEEHCSIKGIKSIDFMIKLWMCPMVG